MQKQIFYFISYFMSHESISLATCMWLRPNYRQEFNKFNK